MGDLEARKRLSSESGCSGGAAGMSGTQVLVLLLAWSAITVATVGWAFGEQPDAQPQAPGVGTLSAVETLGEKDASAVVPGQRISCSGRQAELPSPIELASSTPSAHRAWGSRKRDSGTASGEGTLCGRLPTGPLNLTRIVPAADAAAHEDGPALLKSFEKVLQAPLDAGQPVANGTCGATAAQTTLILLLYHKMGTVWWHGSVDLTTRASPFYTYSVVGDTRGDPFTDLADRAARDATRDASGAHAGSAFPDALLVTNGTPDNVRRLFNLAVHAGRLPRLVLQVRDFRDVLLSGYRYHRSHVQSEGSPEAWLHTPEGHWGVKAGSSVAVSYQDALLKLPPGRGLELEMSMIEDTWGSIAEIARDPHLAAHAALVRYEDLYARTLDVGVQVARFLYGDVRCSTAGVKLARGLVAYTAGSRAYLAAARAAQEAGGELQESQVDLRAAIALIKGQGGPGKATATKAFLGRHMRYHFRYTAAHVHGGKPGAWHTDAAFDAGVSAEFSRRFGCLLTTFGYE